LGQLQIAQIWTRGGSPRRLRVHNESLWLSDRHSLGTQVGEHPPPEAGTRGLV
jgi:hypothetical protein